MKYISTKTYNQIAPVAYRQWRSDSHCSDIHGYSLSFHFEFEADTLDARNWVTDFGGLRPLKDKLEEWFDHKLLVAQDDPHREVLLNLGKLGIAKITEVEKTGCEGIADFLYEYVNTIFLPNCGTEEAKRVWCSKVEVRETPSNMAMRIGHREDNEFPELPTVLDYKLAAKMIAITRAPGYDANGIRIMPDFSILGNYLNAQKPE